jgi:hypothetical protein
MIVTRTLFPFVKDDNGGRQWSVFGKRKRRMKNENEEFQLKNCIMRIEKSVLTVLDVRRVEERMSDGGQTANVC